MRIEEIMFVKDFSKYQMKSIAYISRAAVFEAKHHSLLFSYLVCLGDPWQYPFFHFLSLDVG
jgi:hypothetical protein